VEIWPSIAAIIAILAVVIPLVFKRLWSHEPPVGAARLVQSEVGVAVRRIEAAQESRTGWFGEQPLETAAWKKYRATLAGRMAADAFMVVEGAYAHSAGPSADGEARPLAHHTTGASNGPTEGLNLLVKKVKCARHGFRSFANYRQDPSARRRRELGGHTASDTPHQKPLAH
jgi:Transposase